MGLLVVGLAAVWFWAWRRESVPERRLAAANPNLPLCPVGGEPINFAVSVPSDDGPVFFCCSHCIEKFRADPAKYAEGIEAERRTLAQVARIQVRCPVSGEPVRPEIFVERGAEKTFLCSDECREKFRTAPERYRASLAASYSYQTKCPVSGKPISPSVSTLADEGTTVYLCSAECRTAFRRDPEKYADTLAEQGVRVRP